VWNHRSVTVVRISLFGPFRVEVDGRDIAATGLPRRPQQLVQLLALAPGQRLARDELVEALFGHLDARAGTANLHKAASILRSHTGDRGAVVLRGGMVELWPAATVVTDVAQYERAAGQALRNGAPDACRLALAEHRDDLLPEERYEGWAEGARRRLRGLAVELSRAAGEWERLLEFEPADEAAHRGLMRAHAAAGDRGAVQRQFERLATALEALGVRPSVDTVELHRALTRGPQATAPVRPSRAFVGRRAELARARALWRSAGAGQGGGLLIRGEAGIGKTHFVERLLAEAGEAGWTTLRGSGARVEAPIPYAAIVEAVGRLLRDRPDLAQRLPAPARAVLTRLTAATPRHEGIDSPVTAQQVVSVVARLIAVAARERPVMLFVDDLHAVDDDTLAVVHYLVRAATFQRLLVVAAIRDGEATPAVAEARAELLAGRRAVEIGLHPLTPDEATELVAAAAPGASTTGSPAAWWVRSGGNPFLLLELAAGHTDRAASAVAARLSRLDPALRDVLAQLALAGEQASADELRAFGGGDDERARRVVDAAVSARVLDRDGLHYRFRHGLVREALVEGIPTHRRAEAHRVAAVALEASGAPAARVAHHLLASDRPSDAVGYLVEAATQSMAVGAFAGARQFVERATAVAPGDAALLALRADVAFATGEPGAALQYAAAVGAAEPAVRGPLLVRQARAHVAAGDPAAAAAALRSASVVRAEDVALRRLVEAQIAWMGGDLDACERAVEQARTDALALGLMEVVYGAMSLRDLVLHQRGRFPDGLRRDLLAAGSSPVLAAVLHDCHLCGAETYLYGGRPYEEVKAFARELAATASVAGARRGRAFAVTLLGEAELLSGDLEAAHAHLDEGVGSHAEIGATGGQALALQRLAQLHLAGGRRDDAAAALADALPLARHDRAVGWHLVSRVYGSMVEASASTREAVAVVDAGEIGTSGGMALVCPPCSISFLLPAAIACAADGDVERASRFVAQAEPWVAALWAQGGWQAALDEARGHIAQAVGDFAAARSALGAAGERFRTVGQPLDARRCAGTLARLH
jgi:DNA-binding SARP family transcriptional activator